MKRLPLIISLAALLVSCSLPGTSRPSSAEQPAQTEPQVDVPVLGSTRIAQPDGMTLVFVPGGDFMMGSDSSGYANERPTHTVSLSAYWIDQTEVTNVMFENFVAQSNYLTDAEKMGSSFIYNADTGSTALVTGADWQHPLGPGSSLLNLGGHPVVHVSWNDAQAYCQWAGRRLPTEAEWEKAARGTDGRTFPWGIDFDGTRLNSADVNLGAGRGNNSFDDGFQLSSPAGYYPSGASPTGALDMAGNVWEWVNDWVDETYYQDSPSSNPSGPVSGEYRVVRGGSWHDPEDGQRVTYRGWAGTEDTDITLGFRCALSG